ncbi:MAG: hypothetical protein EZS28_002165 [Streblomastix strix]|uniref:B30.2/SPRY domain-containing protein n=1 Tax=Streblomastix strix TaxID=222440 RepID=A0A5J4X4S6_9EUKA|nr:MAG: hypothetical protein EZS28_002165 [Streblomastix strix]
MEESNIKIQSLEESNRDKDQVFNALNAENTKLKNEIEKIKVEYPQIIPNEYNVFGGLTGVGPDILLLILQEMQYITDAAQFLSFVMKNPDPETVTFEQVDGILRKVKLNKTGDCAIEIDPVITDGIYLFEIIYQNKYPGFHQGPGIVKASYTIPRYCKANSDQNMIFFDTCDGEIRYKGYWTNKNSKYSSGQKIGMELDKGKGTLHFFIDGVQQPVFVRGINEPVRFYGHIFTEGASFTIVTFKNLPAATTQTLPDEEAINW